MTGSPARWDLRLLADRLGPIEPDGDATWHPPHRCAGPITLPLRLARVGTELPDGLSIVCVRAGQRLGANDHLDRGHWWPATVDDSANDRHRGADRASSVLPEHSPRVLGGPMLATATTTAPITRRISGEDLVATLRRRLLAAGIVIATAGSAMLLHTGPALAATPGKVVFHDADNNIQVIDGGTEGQCVDLAVDNTYIYRHILVSNETSAPIRVFYTSDCKATGVQTHPGPQDVEAGGRGSLDGIIQVKSVEFLG